MSAIRAIISRTNPLGTTLLLYGDDLIDDNNELVSAVELPADVFEHLLAFSRGNQEIRAVINYSDDSSIKIYDYADTIVTDENGVQGIILEDTGIVLYSGTQPTIGEDIQPFIVTGGDSLPEVDSDDNGDVLTVVNGEWDKAAPASPLPSVSGSDNGKVLTVVSGEWNKATPASLPAVTSTDNGKVLTVKSGAWTKDYPKAGLDVLHLEIQNWSSVFILWDTDTNIGFSENTFGGGSGPDYDVIEIYVSDNAAMTQLGLGYVTRYYFAEYASDDSGVFKNLNGQNDFLIDNIGLAEELTIGGKTFTIDDTYGYWACENENPE